MVLGDMQPFAYQLFMNKHFVGILIAIFILAGNLYALRWRTVATKAVTLNRDGCAALHLLGVIAADRDGVPERCTLTSRPVMQEVKLKERFGDKMYRLEITRIQPSIRVITIGELGLGSTNRGMKTEAVMLNRNTVVTYR